MSNRLSRMILVLAALAASLPAAPALASPSPQMIGFQGRLLDASSQPRNGSFSMTFALYDVPTDGTSLWSETQSAVPVNNGVFSVQLGAVEPLTQGLFNSASAYLQVQVSPDAPMTPRQRLVMAPYTFRALLADDLAPGNTSYVQVSSVLQSGAVFHVSSGTVEGPFLATQTSSFTAAGSETYSLVASSGIRVLAGTLKVEGSGGVVVTNSVRAATVTVVSGFNLPQGPAINAEGAARWEPTQNLLYIGTGTSNKTMVDTDSDQTLTYKSLHSTGGNLVDATHLQTREISAVSPSDGMVLRWSAGASQWVPAYTSTLTVVTHNFTPSGNITIAANIVYLIPLAMSGVLQLNQIRYRVSTAIGGVTGDVGLYDSSGNLVASGGAGSADFTTTGAKAVTMQSAPVTIQPGQYYMALTCTGAPQVRGNTLGGAASVGVIKGLGTASEAGGTTLPASVSLSAITDGSTTIFMGLNQ